MPDREVPYASRFDDYVDRTWGQWTRRNQRAYIDEPGRVKWILLRGLGVFLAYIALLVTDVLKFDYHDHWWLGAIVTILVPLIVARGALANLGQALAYRNGWSNGHTNTLVAMDEARRRGMYPNEFEVLEIEREARVWGAFAVVYHRHGEHEE